MPWSPDDLNRFADRVLLALQTAQKETPQGGTTGLELEWNLLDSHLHPLQTVGSGPERRSFADVLRQDFLPDWLTQCTQLEVYHWMLEWTTRPHYSPMHTIYEARLLEACQRNALARAGRRYGERLHALHGNLLRPVSVGHDSIPGGWNLAKRRYLERCVDLYGADLATAGIHTNLSLPEPLLVWDFMHLRPSDRGDGHLDDYKNRVYIEATRGMRAFAALFIATTASTPLRPAMREGEPAVVLTEFDSVRTLTFPSPEAIDLAELYRSHADYLRLSYDLVRRGIRFGNNNWTAVRARSFAEPVERLISLSSTQLEDLYRHGLYAEGEQAPVEAMAQQVVIENLLARIDLPMARVEIRTDEGGHPLELDIANLTFKELLLLRCYGDPTYARAFRYDAEDLARARRNEYQAACSGLRAQIEDPFSGKPIDMRAFLRRTLDDIAPLAKALGRLGHLGPLVAMGTGAPNTAESMRLHLRSQIGAGDLVPEEVLQELVEQRERELGSDVERIAAEMPGLGESASRLRDMWGRARDEARHEPQAPIRFRPAAGAVVEISYPDKTAEIVDLAMQLVRIPSVTVAPPGGQRLAEVRRLATLLYDLVRQAGLNARIFENDAYPALLATFPGVPQPPVLLSGHFDVVAPDPDETQFEPRVEGDYLWGRGACDMKTVVATFLIWMKDLQRRGEAPPLGLLLVGNEEIGEGEPWGTPHVLEALRVENGYSPQLLIAGERTGEQGDERVGRVCLENRGLIRLQIDAHGPRGHTGLGASSRDLSRLLVGVCRDLEQMLTGRLTLENPSGWRSQIGFPYLRVGEAGLFNVSPERGLLGIEIRTVPHDRLASILPGIEDYCRERDLGLTVVAREDGIACDPDSPLVRALLDGIREGTGVEPATDRKLAATSARFAPGGRGIVWGQSGIGPHAAGERHFLPSILPYYQALGAFARRV